MARFLRVVESGLGGTPNNFDTISLHTLPNPRPAAELWPDLPPAEDSRRIEHQERVARENAAYARIGGDECGRYEVAGTSIAVPFVGRPPRLLLWLKPSACSIAVPHTPILNWRCPRSTRAPRGLWGSGYGGNKVLLDEARVSKPSTMPDLFFWRTGASAAFL